MTESIQRLLARLYPMADHAALMARLAARMEQTRARISPPAQRELFSEQDVVLITYGGTLRRHGESPLRTLHDFGARRLRGVVSAIHILPFFPYSSDDGFSVQDFYQVDPELGDWDDVRRIGQDFGLMFDAVFNHMSAQSEWFRAFLAGDPEFANLFRTESPDADLSGVTRPRVSPLLTPFERPNGEIVHVWTTFSADQVDFDIRHPDTLLRLIDILLFYVEQGASIIRLDAIAYLWKTVGTSCIHLEETHQVIQLMRAVLDEVAPHVIIITETNVPHWENISYWGDGTNEAQMVYNFTLPPLLFHSMLAGNAVRLREWVNTLQAPSPRTTFFNFTASHDGIGVRPVEGILDDDELAALVAHVERQQGRVNYRRHPDGSQTPYELNCTYVDAVTDPDEPLENQARRFLVSQAVMLALAGVPAVYIHSLLGSRNDVEGMLALGHNRAINREQLDVDAVEQELAQPGSFRRLVFEPYQHLISVRRSQRAFHPNAPQQALDVGSPAVLALLRGDDSTGRVLALHNLSGSPQTVRVAFNGRDLVGGAAVSAGSVKLEPYQALWVAETV